MQIFFKTNFSPFLLLPSSSRLWPSVTYALANQPLHPLPVPLLTCRWAHIAPLLQTSQGLREPWDRPSSQGVPDPAASFSSLHTTCRHVHRASSNLVSRLFLFLCPKRPFLPPPTSLVFQSCSGDLSGKLSLEGYFHSYHCSHIIMKVAVTSSAFPQNRTFSEGRDGVWLASCSWRESEPAQWRTRGGPV